MGDVNYGGDYGVNIGSYSYLDVSTAPALSNYGTYGTASNYTATVDEVTVTAPSHSPTTLEWVELAGGVLGAAGATVVFIGSLQAASIIGGGTGLVTIAAGSLLVMVGAILIAAVMIARVMGFH